jgi:S1-C subfamily serine protease
MVAIISLLALSALGLSAYVLVSVRSEHDARHRHDATIARQLDQRLRTQSRQIAALQTQDAALAKRLAAAQKSLNVSKAGSAPLARRILKSVFTIDTRDGLGTGWAAWTSGGATYLITANHVVADAIDAGATTVTVRRKGKSWQGTIGASDETNDLAVVKVDKLIAPPLWQTPDETISPLPGDELILLGSPYGLEGTVTTGIVSRVAYDEIQTDAAANPGNSGGPGVDARGQVVGVLLAGGGENLNFLVPIQRACVTIRKC